MTYQTSVFEKTTKAKMIENLLRGRGYAGVDMAELNDISFRYGSVIHTLRKRGHRIETVPINRHTGHFKYRWIN